MTSSSHRSTSVLLLSSPSLSEVGGVDCSVFKNKLSKGDSDSFSVSDWTSVDAWWCNGLFKCWNMNMDLFSWRTLGTLGWNLVNLKWLTVFYPWGQWIHLSMPTVLRSQVRIPSTPSMLFPFIVNFCLYLSLCRGKDENKPKEADL